MSPSTFEWLPDRHLDVAATLAHADELIEEVGHLLFEYGRQPQVVTLKEVRSGDKNQAVVDRIAPLPRKIPLLVADALIALRAALEHTLFAEASFLNGGQLAESAARTIEMPAQQSHEGFEDWLRRRGRHAPDSLKPGGELVRRLRGLQPYQRNIRPDLHPMARLASHTNHSKHRTPAVTALRVVAVVRDSDPVRSLNDLRLSSEEPLRVGDVITEAPFGKVVPTTYFPSVGLNRPGTADWPILLTELDEIAWWVRSQAVPRLITGLEPPLETLPARYAIGIGHPDERAAIANGSALSASERTRTHFGASSARVNLVELLLPLMASPNRRALEAWLRYLSDDEVVERVRRLTATPSYDQDAVRANMATIQDFLHELEAFIKIQ